MPHSPRIIWAYSYRLFPPQAARRLRKIRAVLERERRDAERRQGTWEARLVADERIAHILILTDSPDLSSDVHHRIAAELLALEARFSVTVPLALVDDASAESSPPADLPLEN